MVLLIIMNGIMWAISFALFFGDKYEPSVIAGIIGLGFGICFSLIANPYLILIIGSASAFSNINDVRSRK